MDCKNQTTRDVVRGVSVIVATLILSTGACAATSSGTPCEQVGRDLRSLDVPLGSLTLVAVDHVPTDQATTDKNALVAESTATDFAAPLVFLAPRVSSILRDVFATTTEDSATESPAPESSSPLADSEESDESAIAPTGVLGNSISLPHYQRQMYRTDI